MLHQTAKFEYDAFTSFVSVAATLITLLYAAGYTLVILFPFAHSESTQPYQ